MISPISVTGRSFTWDNWFTYVAYTRYLLDNHKLTYFFTILKNERDLPKKFTETKEKIMGFSIFDFQVAMAVVLYFYPASIIATQWRKKTQIITFYNRSEEMLTP